MTTLRAGAMLTIVMTVAVGSGLTAGPGARPQTAARVQAADVAPFLGDWILQLKGPDGPGTFEVSVKWEGDKALGEIRSQAMPHQPITDIAMYKNSLTLSYTFSWENMPVDAMVTLTPAKEGAMNAQIDFAGGAYTMAGTAARKPAQN